MTTPIHEWPLLKERLDPKVLLLGNGASRAVWPRFEYGSLFEIAQTRIEQPLEKHDIDLFDLLSTKNFEVVLAALLSASRVDRAFDFHDQAEALDASYERIQTALGRAVREVHIPWNTVRTSVLEHVNRELREYQAVYSTNYDLLLYWAIMTNPTKIVDFFWNSATASKYFDRENVDVWASATQVFYLHGALHLVEVEEGQTHKRTRAPFADLLSQFGAALDGFSEAVPLFVTEGTSDDKMRVIRSSEYLSFAYDQFADDDRPLAVFGHALDAVADKHILRAINESHRIVLVSTRTRNEEEAEMLMKELAFKMPAAGAIYLFNATTHPLGHPDLAHSPTALSP